MGLGKLFFIAAAICFGLKAFGVPTGRVDLLALGLLFLAIGFIV